MMRAMCGYKERENQPAAQTENVERVLICKILNKNYVKGFPIRVICFEIEKKH